MTTVLTYKKKKPTEKTQQMSKTPTLDKMLKVKDKSQAIGEFLDWLNCRDPKLYLCELDEDAEEYYPSFPSIEKLLAEFFEIDLNEAEKERCQILDAIRIQNKKAQ
jgi:hypothetical protein